MSDLQLIDPAAAASRNASGADGIDALLGDGMDGLDAFSSAMADAISFGGAPDMAGGRPGSEFMVYDANDALLCGGEGIDILLTTGDEVLTGLLNSGKVADIEVLLKGDSINDLIGDGAGGSAAPFQGMDLAEFGINLSDARDATTMSLDMAQTNGAGSYVSGSGWVRESDTSFAHYSGDSAQSDLHMDIASGAFLDPINEAGQLIFQLYTGNG